MSPLRTPKGRKTAGQYGAAKRYGRPTTELEQDLTEARLSEAVERIVANAPPLRPEQAERISRLLRPGGDAR